MLFTAVGYSDSPLKEPDSRRPYHSGHLPIKNTKTYTNKKPRFRRGLTYYLLIINLNPTFSVVIIAIII